MELLACLAHQAASGQELKDRALELLAECAIGLSPQVAAGKGRQ